MSILNRILMNDVFLEENEMVRARDQLPDDMMAEQDFEVRGGENAPPRLEPNLACLACWSDDGCDCV